ncbi:Signal transduction histidine kinase [Pseudomonas flavescens]|uniref:histidine kinase n=1 Tax=Phytopseudomonas flavescens TaxID=29435 RepID=A0A1G8IHC0_9GAMM|nr:ATP-binding protein [Pseudomonas flavescens]SDI18161.1 Signal transduction histidine kinase [Pseudomonas flavescens]
MRILICSAEASRIRPLLAPLGFTLECCQSITQLSSALAEDVVAVLIAEEALPDPADADNRLFRSSVPLVVLAAACLRAPLASAGTGAVIVERPFTARSLCSCLAALIERSPASSTEVGRTAAELAMLQSQRMDAVGSLTGGIAHDFNNMLTGIIGALDIMKRRVASGRLEGLEPFIAAASVSADRASALTQRLLTFTFRQPMDVRPVAVDPLIESLELLIRRTISQGTSLQGEYRHGDARVLADARQLENAILDLAINARDAMPTGGQVRLHTSLSELAEEDRAALPDLSPGRYLVMAFSDTGSGMSSDTLEKVFDPFFTTKSVGQGSGLGLSMVHGFARQSGGQVTIHSEPGVGTTVRLYLPVADAASDDRQVAVTSATGHRVLLVESDSAVRLLLSEVLADRGYEAVNATEPQAAIDLLASGMPFDLLVSAISLPGMTGSALAGVAQGHRPGLPVLLIVGDTHSVPPESVQGIRVIGKPFSLRELSETLAELLPARS